MNLANELIKGVDVTVLGKDTSDLEHLIYVSIFLVLIGTLTAMYVVMKEDVKLKAPLVIVVLILFGTSVSTYMTYYEEETKHQKGIQENTVVMLQNLAGIEDSYLEYVYNLSETQGEGLMKIDSDTRLIQVVGESKAVYSIEQEVSHHLKVLYSAYHGKEEREK